MNRVERGSGMNKEHFIIELKIYLKALNQKIKLLFLRNTRRYLMLVLRKAKQKNKWQNHWETTGYRRRNFERTRH